MLCALKLQHRHLSAAPTLTKCVVAGDFLAPRRCLVIRLPRRKVVATAALQSESNNDASTTSEQQLTSAVGFPSSAALQWTVTQRHVTLLSFIACAAAISATWLFCSAIPTLMAFKKAAESLEKLMDVTREELPDTMAAVRLSGMEISDLTMELSDLGQEITQGVRSSTRAVRLAEERLRRLTNMTPPASFQEVVPTETKTSVPVLAKTARGIREGIVKGRAVLQIIFTLTQYSRVAFNYFTSRTKA